MSQHAKYVRRSFVWQAENGWTLQRPTGSQPEEMWDGWTSNGRQVQMTYIARMSVANLERSRTTMEAKKRERRKNREQDNDTVVTVCVCRAISHTHQFRRIAIIQIWLLTHYRWMRALILCRRFNITQSMFMPEINLNGYRQKWRLDYGLSPERPSFIAHGLASGAVIDRSQAFISNSFINISTGIMASRPPMLESTSLLRLFVCSSDVF